MPTKKASIPKDRPFPTHVNLTPYMNLLNSFYVDSANDPHLKTAQDVQNYLNSFGCDYFLKLHHDVRSAKTSDFNSVLPIHVQIVDKYLPKKGGRTRYADSIIQEGLMRYTHTKYTISSLTKADIEFLLTEGMKQERAQLLYWLDTYQHPDYAIIVKHAIVNVVDANQGLDSMSL